MRKTHSVSLVAIISFCTWFFSGNETGKQWLQTILGQISQGQFGTAGQNGAGQFPTAGNYGNANYGGFPSAPTYPNPNVQNPNFQNPGYQNQGYGAPNYQTANYQSQQPQVPASYASQSVPMNTAPPTPMFGGPAIKIASFNIQVFGDSKASKPYIMATLAAIFQNFSVVAIQEIRTQDDYFIDNFLRTYVNTNGRVYDKVVGPRLGSSVSTEQYCYLYDTAAIELNRRSVFTVNDPDQLLEREPLVAMFRVRGPPPEQAFTFVLVDIHTRPGKLAEPEVNTLAQVYQAVRRASGGEDDIILLGDLNVDDNHLGDLGKLEGVRPIVRGTYTNTRQTEQFDNFIIHQPSTTEFSGQWGVYNVQRQHNLTLDQALQVSDHYPIWAEFSAYESASPGRVAGRAPGIITQ